MICLEIRTSKKGLLWSSEYYKVLIDSLTQGGAQHNPVGKYPDLQGVISKFVCEQDNRFYPKNNTPLSQHDDVDLGAIVIRRVAIGKEAILVDSITKPSSEDWQRFTFDYFGTIGDSKSEQQSKQNRQMLELQLKSSLDSHANSIALSFQLSEDRKERDIDNLVDPLIPFFSSIIKPLDFIFAMKEIPLPSGEEILRISLHPISVQIISS